jgi:hypothetical protein
LQPEITSPKRGSIFPVALRAWKFFFEALLSPRGGLMDVITFRCSSCKQGLKVPADKAGRKVKCTRCGAAMTIPATSQAGPSQAVKPAAASAPKRVGDDEEDSGGVYGIEGLNMDPEAIRERERREEEERRRRARREEENEEDFDPEEIAEKDEELRERLMGEEEEDEEEDDYRRRGRRPKRKSRRKAKLDPAAWGKVRVGLILVVVAVSLLAGAFLLQKIVVLIGLAAGNEYSKTLVKIHPHYSGEGGDLNLPKLMVGLVGGPDSLGASTAMMITSQILVLLEGGVMVVACIICLGVPTRFGAKGLLVTTLIVAAVNLITGLVFKLLPLTGAMNFALVPLLGPEIAMAYANEERGTPLHLLWSGAPYLQVLLTTFIIFLSYAELVLFPAFLRAVALFVKSDKLQENAISLIKLALSQVFMQVAYQLLAMTGTSDVLLWILKIMYCLAVGFFIGQLAWYVFVLFQSRVLIQETLEQQEA